MQELPGLEPEFAPALGFGFARRANVRKKREDDERHVDRVGNALVDELHNRWFSISKRMAGEEYLHLKKERETTGLKLTGGAGSVEAAFDRLIVEVTRRGIRHNLTLAHFLSPAGGAHHRWFREQVREYVRNLMKNGDYKEPLSN